MCEKVDVLVVGGGPAGITASIAAARKGVKVALIERYGFLGGNATFGLIGGLCGFYTSGGRKKRVVGGIAWEIVQELIKKDAAVELLEIGEKKLIGVIPFNHEVLKITLDQLLRKEGVNLLFHSLAVDTIMDGSRIRGVVVESKTGRHSIFADVIIDATGDGDIAAKAGAKWEMSEQPQALTMIFVMGNVDVAKALSVLGSELSYLMKEARQKRKFPLLSQSGGYVPIPGMPGVVAVNLTRIGGRIGIDAFDLTQAEAEGRRQVLLYSEFLRQCVPGFKKAFLITTATQIGVRETRRILGDYLLTEKDVLGCKKFDDAVGCNAWPIEIHEPSKEGEIWWQYLLDGESHHIPYRCLIPQNIEGLLVAGRCISATHAAHASIRATGPCMVTGQAAGTAAALAIKERVLPRQVDGVLVCKTLQAEGVII